MTYLETWLRQELRDIMGKNGIMLCLTSLLKGNRKKNNTSTVILYNALHQYSGFLKQSGIIWAAFVFSFVAAERKAKKGNTVK